MAESGFTRALGGRITLAVFLAGLLFLRPPMMIDGKKDASVGPAGSADINR